MTFTTKYAEMDGIVNRIRTQYKSFQAVIESKVPTDRFKMLEEEVKKQRLQIASLQEENRNFAGEYNKVRFTLNQYESQMQTFTGKLRVLGKQCVNISQSLESLKRFPKEKITSLLKEHHTKLSQITQWMKENM